MNKEAEGEKKGLIDGVGRGGGEVGGKGRGLWRCGDVRGGFEAAVGGTTRPIVAALSCCGGILWFLLSGDVMAEYVGSI